MWLQCTELLGILNLRSRFCISQRLASTDSVSPGAQHNNKSQSLAVAVVKAWTLDLGFVHCLCRTTSPIGHSVQQVVNPEPCVAHSGCTRPCLLQRSLSSIFQRKTCPTILESLRVVVTANICTLEKANLTSIFVRLNASICEQKTIQATGKTRRAKSVSRSNGHFQSNV